MRTVAHYQILDRLGAGGMGVVFTAKDLKLDRIVALKFLPPQLGADDKARARFLAEARAASALDHPNIGTIHAIDETPEAGLFIVMAFYPGESLASRLQRGRLRLPEALDIATQVGEGLARAHDAGIVHRDVKPSNLILTPGGLVKIVDFGLAKTQNVELTDTGATLGTPAYMAPEQTLGHVVDHRADIWALGVVLYNMLAGRLPFRGTSVWELLRSIREHEPTPLVAPDDVQAILGRALRKRPADRYEHIRAMIVDLRAARDVLPRQSLLPPDAPGLSSDAATVEIPVTSPTRAASRSVLGSGERRQITVLACELGDLGALGDRLDPEQLHEVLVVYQQTCRDIVDAFEGHVAHCLDGAVSVHFGYPGAHEDDALRAVTAGLEIAERVRDLGAALAGRIPALAETPLAIRIGVHTGQVVTTESGTDRSPSIVGTTGSLAARALGAAAPGQVVITDDTQRLVRGFFELQALAVAPPGGTGRPIALHRVAGRTSAGSRLEAAATTGLTELVGRERELGLLVERWQDVRDGAGQVVLLSAEGGVGKSRLVAELKDRLEDEEYTALEGRCSPYRRNTPLFPFVGLLGRVFGFERGEATDTRLGKLRATLEEYGLASSEDVYLFASLVSLPLPDQHTRPDIGAQRERERTLAVVLQLLLAIAAERPVLLVVEDLHWIDPTSLELLGMVVDQGPTSPMLTVLTFRPEFAAPWGTRAHVNVLSLGQLSKRDAEQMVRRLAGGRSLPAELLAQIVANADGVPLFLEELTSAVLESGVLEPVGDAFVLKGSLSSLSIPTTLRDSLTARLDRLGSAKGLAQIASVLGRTFPHELLADVASLEESAIRDDLSRLVNAGLLFVRGAAPEARYTFKHALIRDAAYASLLTRDRQEYHQRAARALEARFPRIVETQPELLAHHYTDAGLDEEAVAWWQRAGGLALRRSANVEAAAHFTRALDLIGGLAEGRSRTERELDLLVALGSAQLATMGYAAPKVGDVFTRARALCEQVGESRRLFDVLQGLWAYYLVRAEVHEALKLADRLIGLSASLGDSMLRVEAVLRRGITLSMLGHLGAARDHFEEVLAGGQAEDAGSSAILYGQDRRVACLCHLSVVLWLLGQPDRALSTAQDAVAQAKGLRHAFSLSWAHLYVAIVLSLRGEPAEACEHAEILAALCEQQGFAYRLAQSRILTDWTLAVRDLDAGAIDRLRTGIERVRDTGAEVYRPYYLALLADACLGAGRVEEGLDAVRDALEAIERTGERFTEAEILRLQGELLRARGEDDLDAARASVRRALDRALEQGAPALVLRSATSLVRIDPASRDALALLANVVHGFDARLQTPDLQAARQLLRDRAGLG